MTDPMTGLVGNLTADVELRVSQGGKPWGSARMAIKPFVAGGGEQPETEYINLVLFGSLAENVSDRCHKGDRIVVTGRLEDDTWTGSDGVVRPGQKIVVDGCGLDLRFRPRATEVDHFGLPVDRVDTTGLNDEPF